MSTNETIAEVLRLDAEATPGPWQPSAGRVVRDGETAYLVHGGPDTDAALVAYYRTATPLLAREVQRLQGQVETRDIIIYQVAWQMQAVATAIGMTPEEQAASAEGIGDAIAERVTRLQAERDAAHQDGYRAGQEAMRVSVLDLAQRAAQYPWIDELLRDALALSPERQDLPRRLLDDVEAA